MRRKIRPRGFVAAVLCSAAVLSCAGGVSAQSDSQLTGAGVVNQVEQVQKALAVRSAAQPGLNLDPTAERLGTLADGLRKALVNDAEKPLKKIDDKRQAKALRAYAAAKRTDAYLSTSSRCVDGEATAAAQALAATVKRLAAAPESSNSDPAVITGVEGQKRHPLFAIHSDSKAASFTLVGMNLAGAGCGNPSVSATDDHGKLRDVQPTIVGVLANRIELKLPKGVQPGDYVVHLVPKRKRFLVACSAQPEATTVLRIMPATKASVDYALTESCRVHGSGGTKLRALPAITGTLPALTADVSTASQRVASQSCDDPVSYALTAKATFSDGSSRSIGPISQGATASITAGWRRGLTLQWDPSVRTIFVKMAPNSCGAIY